MLIIQISNLHSEEYIHFLIQAHSIYISPVLIFTLIIIQKQMVKTYRQNVVHVKL